MQIKDMKNKYLYFLALFRPPTPPPVGPIIILSMKIFVIRHVRGFEPTTLPKPVYLTTHARYPLSYRPIMES